MIKYSKALGYELALSDCSVLSSSIYIYGINNEIKLTTSSMGMRHNCESCAVTLTKEQAKELAELLLKMTE